MDSAARNVLSSSAAYDRTALGSNSAIDVLTTIEPLSCSAANGHQRVPVSSSTEGPPALLNEGGPAMDFSELEEAAMRRAIEAARSPANRLLPNPRVGCVLLSPSGTTISVGCHQGVGTPHAESAALANAGGAARGSTAVVTLEPCHHLDTDRAGPCTRELSEAGVARVVFAQSNPNPLSVGGAPTLRANGISVSGGLLADEARNLNPAWSFAMNHQRPFVTWRFATTVDGRCISAHGTSRWANSPAIRRDTDELWREGDTVLVDRNTVLVDNPQLTANDEENHPLPRDRQPLRVVMGSQEVPDDRRVLDDVAETLVLATRNPAEALAELFVRERRHVFLEGGPTLAAAFLNRGLVDEVVTYIAPVLLGSSPSAVTRHGLGPLAEAAQLDLVDTSMIDDGHGSTVRLTFTPRSNADDVRAARAPSRSSI